MPAFFRLHNWASNFTPLPSFDLYLSTTSSSNMKSFISIFSSLVLLQALGAHATRPQRAELSRVYPSHRVHTLYEDDVCAGMEDGTLLPDPDNCQLFYVCYDGEGALASCLRRNCFKDDIKNCVPCAGCSSSSSTPVRSHLQKSIDCIHWPDIYLQKELEFEASLLCV